MNKGKNYVFQDVAKKVRFIKSGPGPYQTKKTVEARTVLVKLYYSIHLAKIFMNCLTLHVVI